MFQTPSHMITSYWARQPNCTAGAGDDRHSNQRSNPSFYKALSHSIEFFITLLDAHMRILLTLLSRRFVQCRWGNSTISNCDLKREPILPNSEKILRTEMQTCYLELIQEQMKHCWVRWRFSSIYKNKRLLKTPECSANLPFVLGSLPDVQSDDRLNEESDESSQEEPVPVVPPSAQSRQDQVESDERMQCEHNTCEQRREHWATLTLLDSLHCSLSTVFIISSLQTTPTFLLSQIYKPGVRV